MRVFDKHNLTDACDWVQSGHLLAYPTEAVWGIGCDPFNKCAVEQILAIKKRPIEKGMIVIAPNLATIQPFFSLLAEGQIKAILKSWENQAHLNQAITWLFPIPKDLAIKIPDWITGARETLAIRVISHPMIAKLCQHLISPKNPYGFLVSTSCNPSGELPAKTLSEAQGYFGDKVGYLDDTTLGFTQPSQIKNALTEELIRQ